MAPPLVIWDPAMLGYDLGGSHPFHPLRWELTWDLAGQLGVLDGLDRFAPDPATDDELSTVHSRAYIAAVKGASGPPTSRGFRFGHGLGNDDNPVFEHMHASAALIAGGSIAAARAIARGEVDRAVNIAGGTAPPRWPITRRGSASTTTRPWPSGRCWTPGSRRLPTWMSMSTTVTGCKRRSTTTRGC